jgi:hypothetical protein
MHNVNEQATDTFVTQGVTSIIVPPPRLVIPKINKVILLINMKQYDSRRVLLTPLINPKNARAMSCCIQMKSVAVQNQTLLLISFKSTSTPHSPVHYTTRLVVAACRSLVYCC